MDVTNLTTAEFLNQVAYPGSFDNARRKDFPLYDVVSLATGDTQKYFFQSDLGDPFSRNIKFPISGSQIFFVTEIELFLETAIQTAANFAAVNTLMQRANLQIILNDRNNITIPLYQCLNFTYAETLGATPQPYADKVRCAKRKLIYPVIINSTSNIQVVINSQAIPTAFNSENLRIKLNGVMFDKLAPYTVDYIRNNQFQNIDFTFYDSQLISTGNETTYNLFASATQDKRALSRVLPMSGQDRAQIYGLEIFVPGTDADTEFMNLLWNSRQQNILTITIDDVIYFQSSIADALSLGWVRGSNFTDGAGTPVDTAYVNMGYTRNYLFLKNSIIFPANGNVVVTLDQPAGSIPAATNYITTLLDAVILRRVA